MHWCCITPAGVTILIAKYYAIQSALNKASQIPFSYQKEEKEKKGTTYSTGDKKKKSTWSFRQRNWKTASKKGKGYVYLVQSSRKVYILYTYMLCMQENKLSSFVLTTAIKRICPYRPIDNRVWYCKRRNFHRGKFQFFFHSNLLYRLHFHAFTKFRHQKRVENEKKPVKYS